MTDQEIRLQFGEMNAGEMRLARALVGWHERETAKLKEALTHAERWRDKLDTKLTEVVEAAERAGWGDVENFKNLPTFITYLAEDLSKAQAELAAMRQPILADDGRSLGQVACECYHEAYGVGTVEKWQAAAQAVVAAARPAIEAECLAQAIRRMEAVPVEELCDAYEAAYTSYGGMGAVRARLIAAAKGQAQEGRQAEAKAEPATFEAHGKTWTRHTPGDPMPCDGGAMVYWLLREELDGDWEYRNLSDYAKDLDWQVIVGWRYADEPTTSPGWTPAVGDTVRLKSGGPSMTVTGVDPLSLMCVWMNGSNELQVEPITTLCLTPAKP